MTPTSPNEFQDLFRFENGARVGTIDEWPQRRRELLDLLAQWEYGPLPQAPKSTWGEMLNAHEIGRFSGVPHIQYKIFTSDEIACSFVLDLIMPKGNGPFPVILNGDACWGQLPDEIVAEALGRGYILATFNRAEIVPDIAPGRGQGLYRVCPGDYGALAAWAWGYHRCIDFLTGLPQVNARQIAIAGHSRGGKTTLLAGATDERIALTVANNSGAGGAGSFKWMGPGSETLDSILKMFGHWFSPRLAEFAGRQAELPFDQHYLLSLIAPRALLTTEALDDAWANPAGTLQTHWAAREAYRFLNAENQIGIVYRQGGHEHNVEDWKTLLDFADSRLRQLPVVRSFDANPFPDLERAFSWRAPGL